MEDKHLYYCPDCNEVFEGNNPDIKCSFNMHKFKANITNKQYIKWVLDSKNKLNIKSLKEKK